MSDFGFAELLVVLLAVVVVTRCGLIQLFTLGDPIRYAECCRIGAFCRL